MADDAEDAEARNNDHKAAEAPPRDDVAVTLMGNVLEKLRILGYERDMGKKKSFVPFTETQFAFLTYHPNEQIETFLQLVLYLLKLCDQAFTVDKFDDVTSKVNKLILALKSMGFALDYSASKLKLGYGEAACAALEFICDKALSARNFTWPRPSYPKEDFADEAEVDEDAEIDGGDDALGGAAGGGAGAGAGDDEEEELYSDIVRSSKAGGEPGAALDESYQQMIVGDVDPLLWKTELERVGPRLKVSAKEDDGKEWHAHIDRSRRHETVLKELLPRATTQLKLIAAQLHETIERMGTKEKLVNSQYESLCAELRALQDKLRAVSDKCKEDADRVNVMSAEHAAITEQLRETKAVMDERGSKMTDTTPLVAIKDALKTLGAEIKNFELRIGVVGHTLMQAKARQAASGLRRKGGARGAGGYQDPEYDQSDEDSS